MAFFLFNELAGDASPDVDLVVGNLRVKSIAKESPAQDWKLAIQRTDCDLTADFERFTPCTLCVKYNGRNFDGKFCHSVDLQLPGRCTVAGLKKVIETESGKFLSHTLNLTMSNSVTFPVLAAHPNQKSGRGCAAPNWLNLQRTGIPDRNRKSGAAQIADSWVLVILYSEPETLCAWCA